MRLVLRREGHMAVDLDDQVQSMKEVKGCSLVAHLIFSVVARRWLPGSDPGTLFLVFHLSIDIVKRAFFASALQVRKSGFREVHPPSFRVT